MLSTRTAFLCILLFSPVLFTPMELHAQIEQADSSDYLQENTVVARNFNLLMAASKGDNSFLDKLIKDGADINTISNDGATPLLYAVANAHLYTVIILLSYNPDLNKMTFRYETPLLIAVKNLDPVITELLIRNGADIDRSDGNGVTPLHYASLYGSITIADMLLYYDADCNKKSADGTSPLMAAVWAGHADVADLLVQNGANIESRDEDGFTPFLIASQNGDTVLMNFLLQKGADLYEKNRSNLNALDLAIAYNQNDAVAFLLEKGDKWASAETNAFNPYRIAYDLDRHEAIRMLIAKKLPGKTGKRKNETTISLSEKFTLRDMYTGISISIKEPVLNGGLVAGCDLKPWYTRVLLKTTENVLYQYWNRNTIIYTGIFKDFKIGEGTTDTKLLFSGSLSAAYLFGNILKGTDYSPGNKLKLIPSATLKLQKNNFVFTTGIEYMRSEFYRAGSVWGRAGFSWCFFADRITSIGKVIRWH